MNTLAGIAASTLVTLTLLTACTAPTSPPATSSPNSTLSVTSSPTPTPAATTPSEPTPDADSASPPTTPPVALPDGFEWLSAPETTTDGTSFSVSYPDTPAQLRTKLATAWSQAGWVVAAQSKWGVSATKLGQFASASLVPAPKGCVLVVSIVAAGTGP